METKQKEWMLYVHVPFCVRKCAYCDFLSFPCADRPEAASLQRAYVDALCLEMEQYAAVARQYRVKTVFIGGGTPSLLPLAETERLLTCLRRVFFAEHAPPVELTMECNPGTVSQETLSAYRSLGINRLSFGLQSAHDDELRLLGRIHTFRQFEENYRAARAVGFTNINLDLMFDLPEQTQERWLDTLHRAISLAPEHISAYALSIEAGTPFAARYGMEYGDEALGRAQYEAACEQLSQAGYVQYEISNFARVGFACRHNLGYWERTPYLGLGLGAASLLDEVRYENCSDLTEYCRRLSKGESVRGAPQPLTRRERQEEEVFLGLRKNEGISKALFLQTYGEAFAAFGGRALERLLRDGLLTETEERYALTAEGRLLANYVMSRLLAGD